MTRRLPRPATLVWIVDLLLIASGLIVGSSSGGADEAIVLAPAAILYATLGSRIVVRQNGNAIGWLLLLVGSGVAVEIFANPLVTLLVDADSGLGPYVAWIADWAFIPTIGPLALIFLLFPDGRPPSPAWGRVGWVIVFSVATAWVAYALTPGPLNNFETIENPIAIPGAELVLGTLVALATLVALLASLSTAFGLRSRYRRSSGDERQQIRWLAAVGILSGAFLALWLLTIVVSLFLGADPADTGAFDFVVIPLLLLVVTVGLGVPVAVTVAIFRYRLWDLDIIVKKAVVAFLLAIAIGAVLGLLVLGGVFGVVGAGAGLAPIVLGVGLGLLFVPLRRLARRIADRIVFGSRATPYEALTSFSSRLGETYSTEDVLPRMAQILGDATGARSVHVWLRVSDRFQPEAWWPEDAPARDPIPAVGDELPTFGADAAIPIRDRGELLGAISMSLPPSDPMNPRKQDLAQDMAAQAGLVLRNVALIEAVRESRRRIVTAQDERARALERNIHDGAQQQLVALSVKLRLAQQLVDRDPAKAQEMLADLQTQTNETLEDLRDLARGIYPPLLADQGLAAALQAQARRSSVAVEVHPDGVGRYRQDVESAVYFCCLEALNNVAKYADASHVDIRLSSSDGELRFEVTDDGRGFDRSITGYGTGLQGMSDRLDAIGGSIDIVSAPGEGTTVLGRLPLTGAAR